MTIPVAASRPVPASDINDSDSESDASFEEPLDLTKDDGWQDVEPEEEEGEPVVSLFSDKVFPDAQSMLDDCKKSFNFDFVKVQKTLGLDFLGTIKLINFIRSEVQDGNSHPDVSNATLFEDEKYLKPVLEDDALLYSIEDLADPADSSNDEQATNRVKDLENELNNLRGEFAEYKRMVQKALEQSLEAEKEDTTSQDKPNASTQEPTSTNSHFHQAEKNYFTSYAYNGIHESMIKDSVRTDAYRDFVYDNKHLFKDKVVLDVGCGTGILSMFCARAGAKQVIAVDNSDIIDNAREIIYQNGFGDVITCLRGKIEEVVLPVKQVDIIISEWMGYCLLFEAMFDSVIWARDRYLAPGGLMVPSHATLRIAPLSDGELVQEHISFWKSIYGFDMSSMLKNVHDEALVRCIKPSALAGDAALFHFLPLHTITTEELIFVKNFNVTLDRDIDTLDGWAVWFDIFFMPSAEKKLDPSDAIPTTMKKNDFVAFTTGPHGPDTHWQQGIFLLDPQKQTMPAMKKGQTLTGSIEYKKKDDKSRLLDININWNADGGASGHQEWALQ
ncbi:hypothetical protein FQN57_006202 [Myotisia sp. PD_48]|nr:hypothetical protein FQN57_006202 [Myotisia sp. PD_48]